jgi:hypothetical protein
MMDNMNCQPSAKLRTYDRFRYYMDQDSLRRMLEPCLAGGALTKDDFDKIGETADFESVFHRLHRNHDYYSLIEPINGPLPDFPEDLESSNDIFRLCEGLSLDAVFVDGCKSWFGTRYFMELVLPHSKPGAWFIFQDYRHHPCFWLPAFIGTFDDVFHLGMYVDHTYAFQLQRFVDADEVRSRFPVEPKEWSELHFSQLFARLIQQAFERDDVGGRWACTVQWAAALAYNGNLSEARRILRNLCQTSWAEPFNDIIRSVGYLTYYPGKTGACPLRLDS